MFVRQHPSNLLSSVFSSKLNSIYLVVSKSSHRKLFVWWTNFSFSLFPWFKKVKCPTLVFAFRDSGKLSYGVIHLNWVKVLRHCCSTRLCGDLGMVLNDRQFIDVYAGTLISPSCRFFACQIIFFSSLTINQKTWFCLLFVIHFHSPISTICVCSYTISKRIELESPTRS